MKVQALRARLPSFCLAAFAAFGLAACGGGGGGPPVDPTAARGALLDPATQVGTFTAAALGGGARCDVRVIALNYRTPGVDGAASNASAALLLPAGSCAAGGHPLLAYARSTEVNKARTLANTADPQTTMLAATYASQGYAVVAIDYLGFAKSAHAFHPYLHADSEATTIVDAIRAARNAASVLGAPLSGKVMLAGYSQGAHASMAAQRQIEQSHAAEINLVAGAHLAGPYNLSGLLASGAGIVGVQYFLPFLVTSWQKIHGNVYGDVRQAFRDPYAGYIESLLPHPTHTFETLRATGLLPGSDVSALQARDLLFQPAYLAAMQSDAAHPLRAAARRNDLLGWSPRARTLLCGGKDDPTVAPALHQNVLKADFDSRGVTTVTSVDVDAAIRAAHGTNGQAPIDPASLAYEAYFAAYHTDFEPPLCHAQARALFDTLR